ncbi:transposase [Salinispora tropica]|uniref:transposase n=1 Tax=Salinispora tropica TaxID=168695 RepID=UPI0009B830EB
MDTLRLDVGPEEGVSPLGRPSKCTEEFQRDAVDLVRSSGWPINQVARELGMSHEALRNWVRKRERQTGTPAEASGAGWRAHVHALVQQRRVDLRRSGVDELRTVQQP